MLEEYTHGDTSSAPPLPSEVLCEVRDSSDHDDHGDLQLKSSHRANEDDMKDEEEEETRVGDDDWELETLVARRHRRATRNFDHDTLQQQPDGHVYECKWRYYDETTWETRETLEDLGYGSQVDAFVAGVRQATTTIGTQQPRQHQQPGRNSGPSMATQQGIHEEPRSVLERSFGTRFFTSMLEAFHDAELTPSRYAPMHHPRMEHMFLRTAKMHSGLWKVALLYCSIAEEALPSVWAHGLVTPSRPAYASESDIRTAPWDYPGRTLFVVAVGLLPRKSFGKPVFDPSLPCSTGSIAPIWLVEYSHSKEQQTSHATTRGAHPLRLAFDPLRFAQPTMHTKLLQRKGR